MSALKVHIFFCLLIAIERTNSATLKDVLNLDTQPLQRVARDNKYYLSRYGSGSTESEDSSRTLKPEESPEARQGEPGNVGKRCSRCYDSDRYDSRSRYSDDRYDTKRSRYPDYDYDTKYYDRYDRYDRYDKGLYDRYNDKDRDRGYDRGYDRYDSRYDRYDRYDNRDRYDRERYPDRGSGYDNRGYDHRGYRPYEERGYERGYGGGRPDYYGSGYASSWNYGRGDDYNRDRGGGGWRDQGYGGYRPRDPNYYDSGYRGTSYLYGRPVSTTTIRPSSQDDNSVTDSPKQTNSPSG